MYAVEFETKAQDGVIKIPSQYEHLNNDVVRVIILRSDKEIGFVTDEEQVYYANLLSDMREDERQVSSSEMVKI